MHIVCCLKQVPDTAEVKIDPETNTLVREGVESILNPYDLVAVEMAVRLKEEHDCRVSAVCMGPPQAESVLRQALSLGIDSAILLSDRAFAGADTLATSYTLAQAVETLSQESEVNLVICGKQAIDGDTAQTGPGIATRLGLTQFTYVDITEYPVLIVTGKGACSLQAFTMLEELAQLLSGVVGCSRPVMPDWVPVFQYSVEFSPERVWRQA